MIYLSRHGNTFEAGQPAVWVGAATDLALTDAGLAQAARTAAWLKAEGVIPTRFIAGPLLRTRRFAEIVAAAFDAAIEIDPDLKELHYGDWEGLDTAGVIERFGRPALDAWEERLAWQPGFGESAALVAARVARFLDRVRALEGPVFACTSNGILRFVRAAADGRRESAVTKVRTGAMCVLDATDGGLAIRDWNRMPQDALVGARESLS